MLPKHPHSSCHHQQHIMLLTYATSKHIITERHHHHTPCISVQWTKLAIITHSSLVLRHHTSCMRDHRMWLVIKTTFIIHQGSLYNNIQLYILSYDNPLSYLATLTLKRLKTLQIVLVWTVYQLDKVFLEISLDRNPSKSSYIISLNVNLEKSTIRLYFFLLYP